MDDTSWSRCEGVWDRLAWARTHAPVPMDTAAAGSVIGLSAQTYRTYERRPNTPGARAIDPQNIIKLGRRWKISWQWIISGEGTPFDRELEPRQLEVIETFERAPPELQEAALRVLGGRG